MPELSPQAETRELLLGTWIGVALIIEMMIEEFDLPRENLLLMLSRAQATVAGPQRTALAGIQMLVERFR